MLVILALLALASAQYIGTFYNGTGCVNQLTQVTGAPNTCIAVTAFSLWVQFTVVTPNTAFNVSTYATSTCTTAATNSFIANLNGCVAVPQIGGSFKIASASIAALSALLLLLALLF
jgi:hypothetical protein